MSKTTMTLNSGRVNLFIPMIKIDEEKRLVYGKITEEIKDKSGEICDYDASKPNFEAWSGGFEKVTGGKSLGNLRSMHKAIAAGKLTDIAYNDEERSIYCCAKVTDDNEWQKCLDGVYTGFSQGGSYGKRWTDEAGNKRYEAIPTEVSLVDNPCLASATFEVIKADGATEMRKFHTWEPGNDTIVPQAKELAKAAGSEESWPEHIAQARVQLIKMHGDEVMAKADTANAAAEIEDGIVLAKTAPAAEPAAAAPAAEPEAVAKTVGPAELKQVQVWEASDGKQFAKKADARAHEASLQTPVQKAVAAALAKAGDAAPAALEGEVLDKGAPCPDLAPVGAALVALRKAYAENVLVKGMYAVSRLADVVSTLNWLTTDSCWEEQYEGDKDSKVPAALLANLKGLGAILVEMATEEVGELVAGLEAQGLTIDILQADSDPVVMELAAKGIELGKVATANLTKAGKRNSAADQDKLNAIHDHCVSLGAACDGGADAEKMAKAATLTQENEALRKDFNEALAGIGTLGEAMAKMAAEIQVLKDQPAPRSADLAKLATKDGDNALTAREDAADVVAKAVETMGAEGVALTLFKSAQQRPIPMLHRGQ